MIVIMRTKAQAKKVSDLTIGEVILDDGKPTRKVQLPGDFEQYREAVESVSVLFQLSDDTGDKVPTGWTITGASFEVEWPKEQRLASLIWSHFGARRFAYNWALSKVKSDIEAKRADENHLSTPWTLEALRKQWNQEKNEVAPWWGENSKEAYASGIADLVQALSNWSSSKRGKRRGKKVGFPKGKSKRKDQNRVRFTTGTMRFEDDHRTIVLPTIGALRSKENTRRIQRHLTNGTAKNNARLLNCTLSERWGRLFVSCQVAIKTSVLPTSSTTALDQLPRAGVDLGLRSLATIADSNGNITVIPNPTPLRATLDERRRVGRALSRRIPGSRGHKQAKAKLVKLDRKAVHIRRESIHQLTHYLVENYSEVKIEDLNIAAMKRSMGKRAFRRSVSDAGLGAFRPTITYKAERAGVKVVVVDRFFPSSQIHHNCTGRLTGAKLAKKLVCDTCRVEVDRDDNAALNIRDWSATSPGLVETSALFVPRPISGTGGSSDDEMTYHLERARKTSSNTGHAWRGKNDSRTSENRVRDKNLVKGASI
ncbi:IS607 family element RNA-guided endonuclease TnpB [Ferrimicrobium sp.]|uniref:IS607 family element RNA-guided endonuclease TnpB n=1 Tax=Ferrimicrobium sp. TaxID=2926050 RepID=UPI00262CDD03|nr:IS607 family element RNA-guided endonuclease TnpB [Ferrimicrobium sp.]